MKKRVSRIFIADDDAEDIMLLMDAFEHTGMPFGEITTFVNGEQVVKQLDSCSDLELPYLVILDINMPRMSGRETLQYIRSNPRFDNISVVIYSTSINPIEQEQCMKLGAINYIMKPMMYKESIDTAKLFNHLCEESKQRSEAKKANN